MKLTTRLLDYLQRRFNRDPKPFLALRLRYNGTSMKWTVADGVLTTTVVGGTGAALSVNLSTYTIGTLATYLAGRPGYSVPYAATDPQQTAIGALSLIDGSGDQDTSNGDHISAYTSLTWAVLEPAAAELDRARTAIYEMIRQMAVPTASDEWLDELGSYYGVLRNAGETDPQYGPRIIAEVVRPLGNNVAMESAIRQATGTNAARVIDAEMQTQSGVDTYGLFDVEAAVDANNAVDFVFFEAAVLANVEKTRDAGTHLRDINFSIYNTGTIYMGGAVLQGDIVSIFPQEST